MDGAIGQASNFDQTFGYYCDGVGPETAILPVDWRSRAIEFSNANTGGVVALVPDPNDIALSKVVAWREKDIEWLRAAAQHLIIEPKTMEERLNRLPPTSIERDELARRIASLVGRA